MKTLNASEEFAVGKNSIGYVSSSFETQFKDKEFQEATATPKFQKLPRAMNDGEIESELKPGICSLGDVLAFIKNPPEGSKDGNWNLFYFPDCVVFVRWFSTYWDVFTWLRDDDRWDEDLRVFSPATDLGSSDTSPSGSLSLEISELKIKVGDKEMIFVLKK